MWSEHCGYKHSRRLLKTLPTEGPRLVLGPGRERGRGVGRRRAGVRVQGRVAQPPERGRAVRGRRDRRRRHPARHLRDRRAADRDPGLAALRRGRRPPPARATCSSARSPGSATTATRSGSPPSAARSTSRARTSRTASSTRCASGLIETDRLIRSAAAGVGNVVVLFGARTGRDGIGGASVLASRRARRRPRTSARSVQIGDPFEEKKLLECSLELLERGLLVALQDLGAAGPHVVLGRDGGQGRGRDRPARAPRPAARGRHGAVRDHGLGVPGADAVRRRARAACEDVLAVCARWEVNATAIGEVTDTRRLRVFDGDDAGRRHAGHGAGRRVPGLRPRARRARDAAVPGAASRCCAADDPGEILLGAARLREPRVAQVGVRAVRLDRRLAHRPPARAGRRRRAACCDDRDGRPSDGARAARDRGRDRRQRPARRRRPVPRRGRGRARVLGEPGLRRRRAARADELPELRQPGEAAHRLAAHARGRRAGRRLPRVRDPGRGRQRLALQRGRRGPDLPDAGRRPGRRAAGRAPRRPARLRARRATRSR